MASHKQISLATDLDVYFCDPHSPWQRGSNENTNGLLRQYFPKGSNLAVHSREHLDAVAAYGAAGARGQARACPPAHRTPPRSPGLS
jgi:hypothetical protein